jgi:hypothetical protein
MVSASVEDLVAAQSRTQGGILLDSSDFVTSTVMDLRNPASEIMDIAIGERYCAVVDAAHIIQVFMHRLPDDIPISPLRSGFQGPHRSSRKVSLDIDCIHVIDIFADNIRPIFTIRSIARLFRQLYRRVQTCITFHYHHGI